MSTGGQHSPGVQRVLTALVAIPIALGANFWLPNTFFLGLCVLALAATSWEFGRLARHWAPSAPWAGLPILVTLAAAGLVIEGAWHAGRPVWLDGTAVLTVLLLLVVTAVMIGRGDVRDAAPTLGLLAFALPYFAVPAVAVGRLQAIDPWLLLLLLLIVWIGDSAAYYVGSAFGKRKLAPTISPNKSWEGAVGGFLGSVSVAAAWCALRSDGLDLTLLGIAAATAIAGQVGDLVESMVKRGAGVKDSSQLLPGHGGLYDRLDALLLAAPVFYLGIAWLRPNAIYGS